MSKITIALIALLLSAFALGDVFAEVNDNNKLYFSEIYIDTTHPEKNWVEVLNPSRETMILRRFRTSNVLTDNCLPKEIRQQGGIEVKPGEKKLSAEAKTCLKKHMAKRSIRLKVQLCGFLRETALYQFRRIKKI